MTKKESKRRHSKSAAKPDPVALPHFVVLFGLSLVVLLALSAWWMSMTAAEGGVAAGQTTMARQGGLAAQSTRVAAGEAMLPPVTATPIPSPTPIPPEIPLPTLTPTAVPPAVAGRAIEVSGDVTLRLVVGRGDFETTGRPVVLSVPTRQVAWATRASPSTIPGVCRWASARSSLT
jgi:hypothetical protein